MLQLLRIHNLALVDKACLEWSPGFTAITGETGAGKSVLLGALSLLAGGRADKMMIRQQADSCQVEAQLFFKDLTAIDQFLSEHGLPPCEEGTLLIQRTLFREKSPRIQINGTLSTVQTLRQLGELWIDFHGPTEPQKLFDAPFQLQMLDLFAQNNELLSPYKAAYSQWQQLLNQIHQLTTQDRLSADEVGFYQEQIRKIESIKLSEASIDELESQFKRLQNSEEWIEGAAAVANAILNDHGALGKLRTLIKHAQQLETIDEQVASPLAERLNGLIVELEDLGCEYRNLCDDADLDPRHAASIRDQMNSWIEIKRKYGGSIQAVIQKRDELKLKVDSQNNVEEKLEALQGQVAQIETQLKSHASKLKESRIKAAKKLATAVERLLGLLGFKKASFQIEMVDEDTFKSHGNHRCEFLFSGNAGQAVLPLNRIASSGEMARVMLAVKAVLATIDATPVLVFDEVDANVGGEIGAQVGKELAQLAKDHQVICVTHLPQVAAQAAHHWVVEKDQSNNQTQVTISAIHHCKTQRTTELARMLGDRTSTSALQHAEELLAIQMK